MPRCDCTQCSQRSSTKCNSHRKDKSCCSRKRSPKRKPRSCECNEYKPHACECNKCKSPVKPRCKCEDYENNESDSETNCNTQSHQFIITVKTTN